MGIKINNEDLVNIYINGSPILRIMINNQEVWSGESKELISCFGNGYWINTAPWTDNIPWIN